MKVLVKLSHCRTTSEPPTSAAARTSARNQRVKTQSTIGLPATRKRAKFSTCAAVAGIVVRAEISAAICSISPMSQRDRISNSSQPIRKKRLVMGSCSVQVGAPSSVRGPSCSVNSSRSGIRRIGGACGAALMVGAPATADMVAAVMAYSPSRCRRPAKGRRMM
jgi:hypothetical protein